MVNGSVVSPLQNNGIRPDSQGRATIAHGHMDVNSLSLFEAPLAVLLPMVFLLGSVIGSFLNVIIYRVPAGESVVFPKSCCINCKSPIRPWHNIPVLGWLIVRGRCADCKASIPFRYPLVELLTGVITVLVITEFGFSVYSLTALGFSFIVVPLIFIDAEHMLLPNRLTFPLALLTLCYRIMEATGLLGSDDLSTLGKHESSFIDGLVGVAVGAGSLFLISKLWRLMRGTDGMGMGDVKMMVGIGLMLGGAKTFLTLFIAALIGSILGIVFAKSRGKSLQLKIPFGIFLGSSSLVALLWGDRIISWYLGFFGL